MIIHSSAKTNLPKLNELNELNEINVSELYKVKFKDILYLCTRQIKKRQRK